GDHAPASSTTCRIIMSESSDYMELSPSKFDQVSACAKLRDTVTGISALHLSIHGMDGRSPSPGNSFMDMYISGKQAHDQEKRGDGTQTEKNASSVGAPKTNHPRNGLGSGGGKSSRMSLGLISHHAKFYRRLWLCPEKVYPVASCFAKPL
ncbi:hypothetical protein TNCV_3065001, partial [Trichonephila clavipes]